MPAPRETVVRLCQTLLPETTDLGQIAHWGQVGFDHIAKDYGGIGTTCGFLPQWLLWRLGCRDAELVCRSAPDEGLRYHIGEQIDRLYPVFKRWNPASWVWMSTEQQTRAMASGRGGPKPGDFVVIRGKHWKDENGDRKKDSKHIFVLLEVQQADGKTVKWRVAQTGLTTHAGAQGGQITTLTGELREGPAEEGAEGQTKAGPNLIFIANIKNEEPNFPRRVIGYTDLDLVSFGAPPDPTFTDLFERNGTKAATNTLLKIAEWLGWYRMEDPGGAITVSPTYLLLDRGHEAYRVDKKTLGPYACSAGGMWVREGNTLRITWDDGTPDQSWTLARTFVPREAMTGTPVTGMTGKLIREKTLPDDMPAKWRQATLNA